MTVWPLVLMSDEEVAGYGTQADAGFGALGTERGLLPLVAMEVDARVVGVIATVDVAQTFVNTTGTAIEATYSFPLPDRAAVHKFQMVVGDRVIDGVIDERGAARQHYDQAIAAGHRAAITEEERPGVFTLRVGNLMPGDTATVRLALVGPLPVDDGEVTFRFPLVIAPRYIPGAGLGARLEGAQAGLGTAADTTLVPDASRISPPVRLPGLANPVRLGLRVALADGVVRDVASSLHAVVVSSHDAQVVEVQPGERLDRDFILRWRIDERALHSALVCALDAGGGGGTFALTLVPPATTAVAAKPRDVVFVIDRSGSMAGWKMVAARRAAARMIDTLTSRDRFCAIAFDNHAEVLPGTGLVEASDRNRFRAVEALAKVESRGGTEIAQPLKLALGMLAGGTLDRERVIMLVTDGQVGNEAHILGEVAPSLRNIKMFTLGIDQAVNAAFLRQLAIAGGGLCELVESEDRLDAVMAKVHRRIGTPIATELALRATGLELDRASLAPAKLPDVYAGAPVVVLGRFRGGVPAGATIEVEGTSLGEPLRMTVAAVSAPSAASWLAASWARAHLRDLEDQYAVAARPDLERSIVQVSKQFSVLSRFTAFLAVDRSEVVNPGGRLRQIVQSVEPVHQPQEYGTHVARKGGGIGSGARPMIGSAPPAPMSNRAPMATRSRGVPMAPMSQSAPTKAMTPAGASAPPRQAESDEKAMASGGPPEEYSGAWPSAPPASPELGRSLGMIRVREEVNPNAVLAKRRAVTNVYLTQLARLAVELEAQAKRDPDAQALRLLRERLTQWVEDVRSAGELDDLASAVDALVQRLSVALAATTLAADTIVIATELAALAGGATPPPQPARTTGRVDFWK
jgi:Ca-activated chloride channel homolog